VQARAAAIEHGALRAALAATQGDAAVAPLLAAIPRALAARWTVAPSAVSLDCSFRNLFCALTCGVSDCFVCCVNAFLSLELPRRRLSLLLSCARVFGGGLAERPYESARAILDAVLRADGDDRLTESISRRTDIPPKLFRSLLTQATETVRAKLLSSANPNQQNTIRQVLDEISVQVGKKAGKPHNHTVDQRIIEELSQDTDLAKAKILEFADANRIGEMIAALSVLSGVEFNEIDGLIRTSNELALMMICKAVALEVDTAFAVILASDGKTTADDTQVFENFYEHYQELSIPSAQRIIRFWQGRQKISQHFQAN